MKSHKQKVSAILVILVFAMFILGAIFMRPKFERIAVAQDVSNKPTPTPEFDQKTALAGLRESIKGKEKEPAEKVFKNIKSSAGVPAGRLLAIMEFGYARSLGVDCTHCHIPDRWASEEKPQKQIARDMKAMAENINESLKNMESLGGRQSFVNCTTCHRGDIKPALNLVTRITAQPVSRSDKKAEASPTPQIKPTPRRISPPIRPPKPTPLKRS